MKKIAVTGAAGVVGIALCEDLAKDYDVVAIDIENAPVRVDVRDLSALEAAFAGCDAVVHLAAYSSVSSTWEEVYATNIAGTYNVFEAARRSNASHVIYASSNHVVGTWEVLAGRELYQVGADVTLGVEEPARPDSLYGVGKVFGEALGRYYSDAFGLNVACIRIGSILEGDSPYSPDLRVPGFLPDLRPEDVPARYAATWMSKRDFARLVRAILAREVPFGIVYGVGDNLTRFWDLEAGRALYGFWPLDGTRTTSS